MNKIFLLFLLLVLLFVKTSAQNNLPPVYEIETDTANINIPDSCWQMLEDAGRTWAINQVSQSPLTEKFHSNITLNSSINTYWIRYRIKNNMAYEAKIYFVGFVPFFDLYTKQDSSSWQHQKTGYLLPWSERDGVKNNFDIPFVIGSGEELLVYQRFVFDVRTAVPEHLPVGFGFTRLLLTNNNIIDNRTYFVTIKNSILLGLCILSAIFSFFFFLVARERVYFHASMMYLVLGGYFLFSLFSDFSENPPLLLRSLPFIQAFFCYFLISTVRDALETKHQLPRWDKFLIAARILPLAWLGAESFFPVLFTLGSKFLAFTSVIIFVTCLPLMRRKNKTDWLLLAAVFLYGIQGTLESLSYILDISPAVWYRAHQSDLDLVSNLELTLVLSWLLFDRYRQLRKKLAQEAFEKEQLAKEKEIERRQLIEQQKLELEKQVTERTAELKQSLEELKITQKQLIQQEKMASLGELTAGIAHEIQNPLNFVNNFSEVNNELIDELENELRNNNNDEAILIARDIKENEQKINHHGKRADSIVKGMLQHSRVNTGIKEPTDINKLADEYLRLSYHGMRAKDKSFNAEFKTEFDNSIGKINVVPQDIGRVLLNLFNNAFYAVNESPHPLKGSNAYQPTVFVSTKKLEGKILISVKDNGNGIPQNIVDKIFQPFFTTKPTGQGTGLGLSLVYDIIKAHGGEIKVETKENEGSEFIIWLPTV